MRIVRIKERDELRIAFEVELYERQLGVSRELADEEGLADLPRATQNNRTMSFGLRPSRECQ